MDSRDYYIKISPGVIKGDIFTVEYNATPYNVLGELDPCCLTASTTTVYPLNTATVYSSMTQVLTSGPNGTSLLTGLTVPIMLTESAIDMGYYTPFDGAILQKDTVNNFLFSATTGSPYTCYLYNTSDNDAKKFLSLSSYKLDWGDGSPIEILTNFSPFSYSHTYASANQYTVSLSGFSPWGITVIKKVITTPFTGITIDNPSGTAYFTPAGGSWSSTTLMYDYIYPYDSENDVNYQATSNFTAFTTTPFIVSGYTHSSLNDLSQYGINKYPPVGIPVTGATGVLGTYWGPSFDGLYTAYTINNIDYYDYSDYTLFVVYSSGITTNMIVATPIVKDETLLNVVMQPEVQTNVYVERGKNSGLESLERLGEVDNLGDLTKYGYGFFNVNQLK